MEKHLKEQLRVAGEMAEKFFPPNFCSEVLDLTEKMDNEDAAALLDSYRFFLETQTRYHATAQAVYENLMRALRGAEVKDRHRIDFLVQAAHEPYDPEYFEPLSRTVRECELKPSQHYGSEDVQRFMDNIETLAFAMNDSPAYPSERALKFYHFAYASGRLSKLAPEALLRRLMQHGRSIREEHSRLTGTPLAYA